VRRLFLTLLFVSLMPAFVKSQDTPPPDYFVEAVVDNPAPYVGQQITYRFRFYDAVGISNPLYEAPDFEGFWRVDKQIITRTAQQSNNRQYTVTELDTALYPTRTGIITIAPAKVLLPENVFNEAAEVSAAPLTIEVKSLPEGAPDGFTGAVGQFDLSATLDRQSAKSGEPFVLRLTVTGTGNVEQLTLPGTLEADGWRIYQNPTTFSTQETNSLLIGAKVYEYLLIPEQIGSQTLPPFTLHYFDPATMQYRSVSTQPVTLEVLPGDAITIQTPSATNTPPQEIASLALKPVSTIAQDITATPGIMFWLMWLLPPLGVGGCWWWVWRQERRRLRQPDLRRSMALTRALGQLRGLSKPSGDKGYQFLRQAILNYFGDKLNRQPGYLTDSDLQTMLDELDVPANLQERVMVCLEWANEGQYAPKGAVDMKMLVNRTSEVLTAVDSLWNST